MIQLQLDNPQMQEIFEKKCHSNKEEFMDFIVSFIEDNKNIVDKYFDKKRKSTIKYKKLNPMENYYILSNEDNKEEMTNPFKDVEDSVTFAKELRKKSDR